MALGQLTHRSRTIAGGDLLHVLLITLAVLIAVLALVAAFGLQQLGPVYDVVPDPAGPLPF